MVGSMGRAAALLWLVSCSLLVGVSQAQTTDSSIPKCALECVDSVAGTTSCKSSDLPCLCDSTLFKASYGTCVLFKCISETISSPAILSSLCQNVESTTKVTTTAKTTSRATTAVTTITLPTTTTSRKSSSQTSATPSETSETTSVTPAATQDPSLATGEKSTSNPGSAPSLSTAAIAGIAGGVAAVIIIAAFVWTLWRRSKRAQSYNDERLNGLYSKSNQATIYDDTAKLRYEGSQMAYELPAVDNQPYRGVNGTYR